MRWSWWTSFAGCRQIQARYYHEDDDEDKDDVDDDDDDNDGLQIGACGYRRQIQARWGLVDRPTQLFYIWIFIFTNLKDTAGKSKRGGDAT